MSCSGPGSCDACGTSLCPGDVLCNTCGTRCDVDKTRGFEIKRWANRGDTIELQFDIVDQYNYNTPIDVTTGGCKVWFTLKDQVSKPDSMALWQGTLSAGIVQLYVGRVKVDVPATATQYVADGVTKLYYDLQLKDASGRISTLEKGLFELSPDISRSTS